MQRWEIEALCTTVWGAAARDVGLLRFSNGLRVASKTTDLATIKKTFPSAKNINPRISNLIGSFLNLQLTRIGSLPFGTNHIFEPLNQQQNQCKQQCESRNVNFPSFVHRRMSEGGSPRRLEGSL